MKQVNITITDEQHEILVKEIGNRMAVSGKLITIGKLARELIGPAINGINGSQPTNKPIKNPEIKDVQVNKEADETASQLAVDFGKLDI